MLKFILTLTAVGAFLGLLSSRSGEEANGAARGAKTGLKIGCGCLLGLLVLLFFCALLLGLA